jgi:hypothetical protein
MATMDRTIVVGRHLPNKFEISDPIKPDTTTTFVVTLRPERGVDGIRALRTLLKFAGRRLGLRAVDVREIHDSNGEPPPST